MNGLSLNGNSGKWSNTLPGDLMELSKHPYGTSQLRHSSAGHPSFPGSPQDCPLTMPRSSNSVVGVKSDKYRPSQFSLTSMVQQRGSSGVSNRKKRSPNLLRFFKYFLVLLLMTCIMVFFTLWGSENTLTDGNAGKSGHSERDMASTLISHHEGESGFPVPPLINHHEDTQNRRVMSKQYSSRESLLRITSEEELRKHKFFRILHVKTQKWLSNTIYSSDLESTDKEKILQIQFNPEPKYNAYTIRGHTRKFITSDNTNRVSFDRLMARGHEMWYFMFSDDQVDSDESSVNNSKNDGAKNETLAKFDTPLISNKDTDTKGRFLYIQARRNDKYIAVKVVSDVTSNGHNALKNDVYLTTTADGTKSSRRPAAFELYAETSPDCSASVHIPLDVLKDAQNEEKEILKLTHKSANDLSLSTRTFMTNACIRGNMCWGPFSRFASSGSTSSSNYPPSASSQVTSVVVPLFGSPKPPPASLLPKNSSNPYDSVVIAKRTLANWALIGQGSKIEDDPSGDTARPNIIIKPLIFADSTDTIRLVETVNIDVKELGVDSRIRGNESEIEDIKGASSSLFDILQVDHFEIHPQFKQPTYRGLFAAALKRYPNAPAVMYSNMDIMYTPSLKDTISAMISLAEKNKAMRINDDKLKDVSDKGWMIVGRRINVEVPPNWSPIPLENNMGQMRMDSNIGQGDSSNNMAQKRILNPRWIKEMEVNFTKEGSLFQTLAEDYFIVSRTLINNWMTDIPDFVVGGAAFDNWFTSKINKLVEKGKAIVVDGTGTITAIHQNHGINMKSSHEEPKSTYNIMLAAKHGGWGLGHTSDARLVSERGVDGRVVICDKHRLLYK